MAKEADEIAARPTPMARLACAEFGSSTLPVPVSKGLRAEVRSYWDRSPLVLVFIAVPVAIAAGVVIFDGAAIAASWTFLLSWLAATPFVVRWVILLRRRVAFAERARRRRTDHVSTRARVWGQRRRFDGPSAVFSAGARALGLRTWPVFVLWPMIGVGVFMNESSHWFGELLAPYPHRRLLGGMVEPIMDLVALWTIAGLVWVFVTGLWHYRAVGRLLRRINAGACLGCGYDLRGLDNEGGDPVAVCPECGVGLPTMPPPTPEELGAELERATAG